MSITDKTRKLLWGQSGNRCAYCRTLLTMDKTAFDDHSIVGDECHIVSRAKDGIRWEENLEDLDSYENLILLCKNHHKLVDDQPNFYSKNVL